MHTFCFLRKGFQGLWEAVQYGLNPTAPKTLLWMNQTIQKDFPYRFDVFDPQYDDLAKELESKPEIGRKSAEESRAQIAKILEGTDMVFITAGMGGGTGTGAAPIVADLAREAGILTVGVVTKPFKFEGANRMRQADQGIADLSEKVDSLIIIPNDRLKYVTDQKITFANAFFGIADDVLKQAVTSISELVGYSEQVIINLDFADVSAVMRDAGRAHLGVLL